jgi:hypothetical protein
MMSLWVSYKKKILRKKIFFYILKVTEEKKSDPVLDPDPLVRGTDSGIRKGYAPKCHGSPTLLFVSLTNS